MSAQDIQEFSLLEVNTRDRHSQTDDWQNIQAKSLHAAGKTEACHADKTDGKGGGRKGRNSRFHVMLSIRYF